MKSLLTIVLLSMPLVASAHSSFKVKGKVSYCDAKGANLEEAFIAAKQMAEDTAAAICGEKGLYAARVTDWKTDDDRSDCTAKAKARFICAIEPVQPPVDGKGSKSPEQAPLPGQSPIPGQEPLPGQGPLPEGPTPQLPQEDPTLPPAPVPQLPN